MKNIIKKLLKEHLYKRFIKESLGYPVVTLSSNSLITKSKNLVEETCDWIFYNTGKKEMIISSQQILDSLQHDLNQLSKKEKLDNELKEFEALLIDGIGDELLLKSMDVDDYKRLMNQNATIDSLNAPKGAEHDSLLDKDGNLNYGSGEQINLEEPVINVSIFEKFVENNPEYKPHFDKWYNMMTAAVSFETKLHIYHEFSFSINDFQRAIKAVEMQNVSAKVIIKN